MDSSSLAASSPVIAATAPLTVSATKGENQTGAAAPSPEPSVQTVFSDFARNLLALQANNPTQAIDAALARNLLSPTLSYVAGGQLYTSAGLLQQYATYLFLSQLESSQLDDSNNRTTLETPGFSFFGSNSSQAMLNILNSYQQISLIGGLPLLDTSRSTTARSSTDPIAKPTVTPASASPASNVSANAAVTTKSYLVVLTSIDLLFRPERTSRQLQHGSAIHTFLRLGNH